MIICESGSVEENSPPEVIPFIQHAVRNELPSPWNATRMGNIPNVFGVAENYSIFKSSVKNKPRNSTLPNASCSSTFSATSSSSTRTVDRNFTILLATVKLTTHNTDMNSKLISKLVRDIRSLLFIDSVNGIPMYHV